MFAVHQHPGHPHFQGCLHFPVAERRAETMRFTIRRHGQLITGEGDVCIRDKRMEHHLSSEILRRPGLPQRRLEPSETSVEPPLRDANKTEIPIGINNSIELPGPLKDRKRLHEKRFGARVGVILVQRDGPRKYFSGICERTIADFATGKNREKCT